MVDWAAPHCLQRFGLSLNRWKRCRLLICRNFEPKKSVGFFSNCFIRKENRHWTGFGVYFPAIAVSPSDPGRTKGNMSWKMNFWA
jgi:hypothetical protein